MLELNAKNTALVVIDLQEGILPFAGGPHRADEVVARAARLADKCRQQGSPVIMVRVGWSADFAEALKQPVDAQAGAHTLPENWWTYPATLGKQESDIEVTKRQWGAFYGCPQKHRAGFLEDLAAAGVRCGRGDRCCNRCRSGNQKQTA